MKSPTTTLTAALLVAFIVGCPLAASELTPAARGFLQKHCAECHDADTEKGKFRVDTLPGDVGTPGASERWGKVLTRLEAGEMPPPKHERPPAAEVDAVLGWAKTELAAAAKKRRATEGRVSIRRLNRLEYENTLHDLLGIDTPLQELLPEDELADGFDNASKALSISPVHIQRYLDAAELALKAAIIRGPKPALAIQRFSYDHKKEEYFMNHGNNKPMIRPRYDGEIMFFSEPHIEVPGQLNQFAEVTKATPGHYKVRVSAYTADAEGTSLTFAVRTTRSKQMLGYFDAPPDEATEPIEVQHAFSAGDSIVVAPYRLNQARGERKFSQYPPKPWKEPEGLALAIQWVEVEGPLIDTWPPVGHVRLFGDVSLKPFIGDVSLKPFKGLPKDAVVPGELGRLLRNSDKLTPITEHPEADAKKLLADFLARAFRHSVTDDDVAEYLKIVTEHLARKECFETSMMAAYSAVLCSPDFLFLVDEPGPLNDHALACRLSYFLWRSCPDDQLRAAADKGELHRPEILRRETERLLAAPRSKAFVADFLNHWLHLRDIDATTPDKLLFPEYFSSVYNGTIDGLLRESVLAETRMFFTELLKSDGSLLQMIDSDFTYLNSRLAEFYGLPAVDGVAMRRVALPPESVRGGVLTQASVLKVTSNGSRTSPVLRGAWVLDNIIGRPPPPPPPNAGSIEPDTRGATNIREQLNKHKNNETCAACHQKIDPPGFALECFDPVGQWRDFYRTTEVGTAVKTKYFEGAAKYKKGAAVDSSGQTSSGEAFSGPKEFKKLALQQADVVTRCLAAKLTTFATGRRTDVSDILALDAIVAQSKKQNYGLRTLIHGVVQSELFLNK